MATPHALQGTPVLVVGAGIMGAGIAQVAAQAGQPVLLFDTRAGAAADAKTKLGAGLDALVAKGKFNADAVAATLARIEPVASLDAAAPARLVVEAIVENVDAKRTLFQQLEAIVADDCVLATNTSSISVTAIANGLQQPQRLVGMHFFNPVPQMKLVEVVSGLRTAPGVAGAIFELSKAWGKVPVHARSTPGFIVNRIARPYYAEALALLHEQATTPPVLDACLRGAGFRMGPCELMDLIGHDTNFAVTQSVYEAFFYDKRFAPSPVQRELVDGGLLGRKSGQGFYTYPAAATAPLANTPWPRPTCTDGVVVHGSGPLADWLAATAQTTLELHAARATRQRDSRWVGIAVGAAKLVRTDGRSANELAAALAGGEVAVFDFPAVLPAPPGTALAFAMADAASEAWRTQAPAWLAALGFAPREVADTPGLLVARTLAMLINEAADAVQQGVCTAEGANAAMKLGVNYPEGPFEWLARWGTGGVIGVLQALDAVYRGERYRVSPWLQRKAALR